MANKNPVYVARSGTVAATVYKENARRVPGYRIVVAKDEDGQPGFTLDELCMVRNAISKQNTLSATSSNLPRWPVAPVAEM